MRPQGQGRSERDEPSDGTSDRPVAWHDRPERAEPRATESGGGKPSDRARRNGQSAGGRGMAGAGRGRDREQGRGQDREPGAEGKGEGRTEDGGEGDRETGRRGEDKSAKGAGRRARTRAPRVRGGERGQERQERGAESESAKSAGRSQGHGARAWRGRGRQPSRERKSGETERGGVKRGRTARPPSSPSTRRAPASLERWRGRRRSGGAWWLWLWWLWYPS